jgi:acyl carrier protein
MSQIVKAIELADDPVMLLLLASFRRHLDTFGIPATTINKDTNLIEAAVIDSQSLLDLILEVENGCGRTFDPLQIDFESGVTLRKLACAFA